MKKNEFVSRIKTICLFLIGLVALFAAVALLLNEGMFIIMEIITKKIKIKIFKEIITVLKE